MTPRKNPARHWFALALVLGFPVYALLHSGPARSCSPLLPGLIPTATAALPTSVVPAPEWTLETPDGKTISNHDFAGKPIVLNFWGTWCPPCREEIPALIELQKTFADRGLTVIGVAIESNPGVLPDFIEKNAINYPVVLGNEKTLTDFGGVQVFPTTFFIDRAGKIKKYVEGSMEFDGFAKAASSILE